jgi:hypothetical protein
MHGQLNTRRTKMPLRFGNATATSISAFLPISLLSHNKKQKALMPRRAVGRDISCLSDFDPPQKCFPLSILHSFFFSLSFIDNNRKKNAVRKPEKKQI